MIKEARFIIAGGRDFEDYDLLESRVDAIISRIITELGIEKSKIKLVSGGAIGADTKGEEYGDNRGYRVVRFLADWDNLGKLAGFIRNEEMAKYASESEDIYGVLVAFWDGKSKGTKNMIDHANKYKLREVHIVKY